MNKDWNPTDEDTWLSNAARELFEFPLVKEWINNPDYVYKSVYFDGTGITDKGKKLRETIVDHLSKYARPYDSYDYLHSAKFIANRKAAIKREIKQPISEHRVCPYCGKEGVIEHNTKYIHTLFEDNGSIHSCPALRPQLPLP